MSVFHCRSAHAAAAAVLISISCFSAQASTQIDPAQVAPLLRAVEPQVISWRRDIHQHPELSNREFRTAKLVAEHLKKLGLEVQTGIAHTGVAALLKGGRP